MRGLAGIAALALLLTGCATAPRAGSIPAGSGPRASPGNATGAGAELPAELELSGPSAALLDQSRAERENGNLGGAAATIERALSIAPDEALLWVELAEIRRDQGETDLAREMARKALTLVPAGSPLAGRAERLIGR